MNPRTFIQFANEAARRRWPDAPRRIPAAVLAAAIALAALHPVIATARGQKPRTRQIEALVAQLQVEMGMSEVIQISIVEGEPLLFSVRPNPSKSAFHLHADKAFLEMLSADELRAAVAHELGHVWIFTHHPFLQTEALANKRAQEVVDRGALEDLYRTMWGYQEKNGDLESVLGPRRDASSTLAGLDRPGRPTSSAVEKHSPVVPKASEAAPER